MGRIEGPDCAIAGIKEGSAIYRRTGAAGRSIGAVDAEIDDVAQGEFPRRGRKQLQGIARHGAIMAGSLDGVRERTVLVHGRDRGLEVALRDLALLQGPAPEPPFLLRTAPERQNDRQGYLPFPEIVADILAKFG